MREEAENRSKTLLERTKRRAWILLGFLMLFLWFGARLVVAESPEKWKEADVTITNIQRISIKPNHWQLTDDQGSTYSAAESDKVMNQIIPQTTYHIVYSPNSQNGIRALAQGNRILVDYANSVSVYCERSVWDWGLCFVGLAGVWATIFVMIWDIRKKMNRKNQKR